MNDRGRAAGPVHDFSGNASGSASQVMGVDPYRQFLMLQNLDDSQTIWINFGAVATMGPGSLKLPPGGSVSFDAGFVPTDYVSIIASGSSVPFTAKATVG